MSENRHGMCVSDLRFSVFAQTLGLVGYCQLVYLVKSARIFVVENCNVQCCFARRQVVRDNLAGKKLTEIIPGSFFQVLPGSKANKLVLVVVFVSSVGWEEIRCGVPVALKEVHVV